MGAYEKSLNRLNHINLLYAGAISELANGQYGKALMPLDAPGMKRTRDLLQLVVIARAELNAFTALMFKKGIFTPEEYREQIIEEAEYLAKVKAEQFSEEDGITYTVTDHGLNLRKEP